LDKTNDLELICSKSYEDQDPENHLAHLHSGKKQMLESSVYALQEGEALLEKLDNLWWKFYKKISSPHLPRQNKLALATLGDPNVFREIG
jgi:hypothetical protein